MGQVTCCDSNRLSTNYDVPAVRLCTDSEVTEFAASFSHVFSELKSGRKENTLKKLSKQELNGSGSMETDYTPNTVGNPCFSFSPQKLSKDSRPTVNRIFSSNASVKSINLIEKINKPQSLCSTNVNSISNSRCVSPISKVRTTLME